eukprot:TRINITY_DN55218_c0_g1_i1.p1 TRINITY_DN55218_c0_g1~~TRINITY_DN55218_c0_g1_i1.p1  ORF type:complete len:921 (-),score=114.22 TRINITY_DN55218_c0_g1_i1:153-2840(-)
MVCETDNPIPSPAIAEPFLGIDVDETGDCIRLHILRVLGLREVANAEKTIGPIHPYVTATLAGREHRTTTLHDTLEPSWTDDRHEFVFPVCREAVDGSSQASTISFEVVSEQSVFRSVTLGKIDVPTGCIARRGDWTRRRIAFLDALPLEIEVSALLDIRQTSTDGDVTSPSSAHISPEQASSGFNDLTSTLRSELAAAQADLRQKQIELHARKDSAATFSERCRLLGLGTSPSSSSMRTRLTGAMQEGNQPCDEERLAALRARKMRLQETLQQRNARVIALATAIRAQQVHNSKSHASRNFEIEDALKSNGCQGTAGTLTTRVTALSDELQQKKERAAALKARERQLEAELRQRMHFDSPIIADICSAANELREDINLRAHLIQTVAHKNRCEAAVADKLAANADPYFSASQGQANIKTVVRSQQAEEVITKFPLPQVSQGPVAKVESLGGCGVLPSSGSCGGSTGASCNTPRVLSAPSPGSPTASSRGETTAVVPAITAPVRNISMGSISCSNEIPTSESFACGNTSSIASDTSQVSSVLRRQAVTLGKRSDPLPSAEIRTTTTPWIHKGHATASQAISSKKVDRAPSMMGVPSTSLVTTKSLPSLPGAQSIVASGGPGSKSLYPRTLQSDVGSLHASSSDLSSGRSTGFPTSATHPTQPAKTNSGPASLAWFAQASAVGTQLPAHVGPVIAHPRPSTSPRVIHRRPGVATPPPHARSTSRGPAQSGQAQHFMYQRARTPPPTRSACMTLMTTSTPPVTPPITPLLSARSVSPRMSVSLVVPPGGGVQPMRQATPPPSYRPAVGASLHVPAGVMTAAAGQGVGACGGCPGLLPSKYPASAVGPSGSYIGGLAKPSTPREVSSASQRARTPGPAVRQLPPHGYPGIQMAIAPAA